MRLFPVPPAVRVRLSGVAAGLGLVLCVAGLQLLRFPAALDRIWAEDGKIFLQQAHTAGRLGAYTLPYAGYLHAIPRTAAVVVASFPLSWAAVLYAVVSGLVVGLLALFIYCASRGHVASRWWRLVLAGTLAFLPVGALELVGTGVNLQWYAMCATFWALLWRPRTLWPRVAQTLLCTAAALSDPLTALFLPLVALRLGAVRDWREQLPVIGWAAGLLVQLGVALNTTVPHSDTHGSILSALQVTALRVFTPFLLGDNGTKSAFANLGWWVVVACVIFVAALLAVAGIAVARRRLPAMVAWLAVAAVVTAVLFFVVPVETRWTPLYVPQGRSVTFLDIGGRYVAVPLIALWSATIVALARAPRRVRIGAGALAVAVLGTMWGLDFRPDPGLPGLGPAWSAETARARAECRQNPGATVRLLTAPPNGTWTVTLPCSRIDR